MKQVFISKGVGQQVLVISQRTGRQGWVGNFSSMFCATPIRAYAISRFVNLKAAASVSALSHSKEWGEECKERAGGWMHMGPLCHWSNTHINTFTPDQWDLPLTGCGWEGCSGFKLYTNYTLFFKVCCCFINVSYSAWIPKEAFSAVSCGDLRPGSPI